MFTLYIRYYHVYTFDSKSIFLRLKERLSYLGLRYSNLKIFVMGT
jgi:hypothetical protein